MFKSQYESLYVAFDAAQTTFISNSFGIQLRYASLHLSQRHKRAFIVCSPLLSAQRTYSFDLMGSWLFYSNCCIRLIPPRTARIRVCMLRRGLRMVLWFILFFRTTYIRSSALLRVASTHAYNVCTRVYALKYGSLVNVTLSL